MGDAKSDDLRVGFDSRLKLRFCGSKVTSDAGLLAYRELDEALGLTEIGADLVTDSRLGSNKQHLLVPLRLLDGAIDGNAGFSRPSVELGSCRRGPILQETLGSDNQ